MKNEDTLDLKQEIEEQPKFLEVMLAPCHHCGYTSVDINRCVRCKRKYLDNVKSIPEVDTVKIKPSASTAEKTFYPKVPIEIEALMEGSKGTKCAYGKKKHKLIEEPVVLTLSSDEDNNGQRSDLESNALSEISYSINENSFIALDPAVTSYAMEKEPKIPAGKYELDVSENWHLQGVRDEGRELNLGAIIQGTMQGQYTLLQCRTVWIGSYNVIPRERVIISNVGVKLSVPSIEDCNKKVTLTIDIEDFVKVLIHFDCRMPVVFLYTSAPAAARIRNLLKMECKLGPYFDPSSGDDTQQRITLLPARLLEESKVTLKTIFGNLNILAELNDKEVNDILVRTSSKQGQNIIRAVGMSPAKNQL